MFALCCVIQCPGVAVGALVDLVGVCSVQLECFDGCLCIIGYVLNVLVLACVPLGEPWLLWHVLVCLVRSDCFGVGLWVFALLGAL